MDIEIKLNHLFNFILMRHSAKYLLILLIFAAFDSFCYAMSSNVEDFSASERIILSNRMSFAQQVKNPNTIYEIKYDFDLKGQSVNLPEGAILVFNGGSISNGELVGKSSSIESDYQIFSKVLLKGTWQGSCEAHWYAKGSVYSVDKTLKIQDKIDVSEALQYALNSSFSILHFRPGFYYISSTLYLNNNKDIVMDGGALGQYLLQGQEANENKTVIFTDKDITMLRVQIDQSPDYSKDIRIVGGNFDASLCYNKGYDCNCIEVDITNNRKIWGFYFDSAIWGTYSGLGKCPNGKGIAFITDSHSSGYATMIRIKGNISWFNTAIDVISNGRNWITDVVVDGVILNCATAIRSNTDIYAEASIQPFYCFTEQSDTTPLIDIEGGRAVIGGMIWDVGNKYINEGQSYYTNKSFLNISYEAESVSIVGKLKDIYHWYDNRITGDRSKVVPINLSMGDVTDYSPNLQFNFLESFLNREGRCNVQLLKSDGTPSGTNVTVSGVENLFSINKGNMAIRFPHAKPDSSEYVEIRLENVNVPIVYFGLSSCVQYINSCYTTNFESCEVEFQMENAPSRKSIVYSTEHNHAGLFVYDFYQPTQYMCKTIVVRLYNINGDVLINKLIANKLRTQYSPDVSTYLPISGGNVYNTTDFQSLSIGGYAICPSDDKLYIDEMSSIVYKNKWVPKNGVQSLFSIKSDTNPVLQSHIVVLSSVYGISPCKSAIYKFNVVGYTGNSRLEIVKLAGNIDYDFKVFKDSSHTADYIIALNTAPLTSYGVVMSKLNSDSSNAFDFINISESDILQTGYSAYKPISILSSGKTSERPSHEYISPGYEFFDTDMNKPVWYNGSYWVDASGRKI